MSSAGVWGPFVYIGLLTVSVVISQIPGLPLAIAEGLLGGRWLLGFTAGCQLLTQRQHCGGFARLSRGMDDKIALLLNQPL